MQSWSRFSSNDSDPTPGHVPSVPSTGGEPGPYRATPCPTCASRDAPVEPRRERSRVPVASLAAGAVAGAVLVGSVTALTTPRLDAQASRLSSLERRVTETELDARAFEGRVDDHVSRIEATLSTNDRLAQSAFQHLREELATERGAREPDARGFDVVEISPTEFLVARAVLLEDQGGLVGAARLLPSERDGVMIGVRVFGVRPGTLPARLGVRNGDTLVSINGVSFAGSPDVERLLAIARDSTAAELVILRRGEIVRLRYTVVG